jgi:UDP-N-acetyl-D-glucosamine dehydrogenase
MPFLESTGLRVGQDINLAFSPERVDPGRTDYTLPPRRRRSAGSRQHGWIAPMGQGLVTDFTTVIPSVSCATVTR